MKIEAVTIQRYKGPYDEDLVATRLLVAWDNLIWSDVSGLRRYESEEWSLLLMVMALGCRAAGVSFAHRELSAVEAKNTEAEEFERHD